MNAHWILQLRRPENEQEFTNASFHCSNCCGVPIDVNKHYPLYERYCHKCGAHMVEEPVIEIQEYKFEWE